jgi:hypothetical protein
MNAANETTKAISQGFVLGFQSWSACVSVVAAAALIRSLYVWCSLCDSGDDHVFGFQYKRDERQTTPIRDAERGKLMRILLQ